MSSFMLLNLTSIFSHIHNQICLCFASDYKPYHIAYSVQPCIIYYSLKIVMFKILHDVLKTTKIIIEGLAAFDLGKCQVNKNPIIISGKSKFRQESMQTMPKQENGDRWKGNTKIKKKERKKWTKIACINADVISPKTQSHSLFSRFLNFQNMTEITTFLGCYKSILQKQVDCSVLCFDFHYLLLLLS